MREYKKKHPSRFIHSLSVYLSFSLYVYTPSITKANTKKRESNNIHREWQEKTESGYSLSYYIARINFWFTFNWIHVIYIFAKLGCFLCNDALHSFLSATLSIISISFCVCVFFLCVPSVHLFQCVSLGQFCSPLLYAIYLCLIALFSLPMKQTHDKNKWRKNVQKPAIYCCTFVELDFFSTHTPTHKYILNWTESRADQRNEATTKYIQTAHFACLAFAPFNPSDLNQSIHGCINKKWEKPVLTRYGIQHTHTHTEAE